MNSILTSVKKLLGIAEECTDFDADIIMYINMALFALAQMGVGPGEGYAISGKENEWTEFVADPVKVEAVKAYVAVKVRLLGFDPPQSSNGCARQGTCECPDDIRCFYTLDKPFYRPKA